jgi:hypothetical protein
MGRIYRDSALTLSATSAKTSEDGFLGPYNSDLFSDAALATMRVKQFTKWSFRGLLHH